MTAAIPDKPPQPQFTPQQQDAIWARNGSVLVSAAAGSGKTAVLVERVVQRILDPEDPVDADRLLVVTFSNAAANEMKGRISARLSDLVEQYPQDLRLQRQLILVERANISTIHSFCLELIRENFQKLEISPDFRIADENEMKVLRARAVEEVTEQFYQEDDGSFADLVELLSTHQNDRGLTDTVLKLYDFIRSHPFYQQWLEEKLALYDPNQDLSQSVWAQTLFSHAEDSLVFGIRRLEQGLSLLTGDAALEKAYGPSFSSDLIQFQELLQAARQRQWNLLYHGLQTCSFSRLGALRKYEDTEKKEQVTGLRDRAKEVIAQLKSCFCADLAGFQEDIADLQPKIQMLFSVTSAFDQTLTRLKTEKKAVDFSDLEHLALKLLFERRDGRLLPSPLAEELSQQFAEICIDEYQDTNEAQDRIFSALSRNQENLFLVGDVKQSIYRFRQAMPEIFLEKKARFVPFNRTDFPAKIILGRNFRSRREITASINFFFSRLMSEKVGEISYQQEEQLIPGASYPDCPDRGVQAVLLDVSESARPPVDEAKYVARRIAQMLESGYPVTDGGQLRPISPKDICILLRSPRGRAELYSKELAALGIQAWTDSQNGYLASREVSVILSLLRVIDNPLLDIPLTAAMMSPIFGFSADELSKIRLLDRTCPLYLALCQAVQEDKRGEMGEETGGKIERFLEFLAKFRRLAAYQTTENFLREIYRETDFPAMVQVMRGGETRRANLLLLIDYAYRYEKSGYKGLSGFIRFVDEAQERGTDFASALTLSESADAVKIMSIHRSKGLEYPVVFLADTGRLFNKTDRNSKTLLHSQKGFACIRRDQAQIRQFTTVPREALRLDLDRSMLSEEMRVLYVAMTRAKETLIITSALKDPQKAMSDAIQQAGTDKKADPYGVIGARSYSQWLLMALSSHPAFAPICRRLEKSPSLFASTDPADFPPLSILLEKPPSEEEVQEQAAPPPSQPDPALVERIRSQSSWRYPFQADTETPSKLSVSQILRGEESAGSHLFQRRPKFLTGTGLTAAERGNALHKFMQFCRYEEAAVSVEAERNRLCRLRYLTEEEGKSIRLPSIRRFFSSPTAQRIFQAEKVWRELRFLSSLSPEILEQYSIHASGETTVQGVADCVFSENGQAVIVDYKTDYAGSPEDLLLKYGTQLLLYRHILENSMGLPVKECLLYSFSLGKAIPVPFPDPA